MRKATPKMKADLLKATREMNYATALRNAYAAADAAQAGMVEDTRALNCGFAWVVVHDRAFMTWCRKQIANCEIDGRKHEARRYGDKHHAAGWCFWKPGSFNGQQVDIHEAGAKAFSETLAHELQIRTEWGSRLD